MGSNLNIYLAIGACAGMMFAAHYLMMRSYASILRPLAEELGGRVTIPFLVMNPVLMFKWGTAPARITLTPPDKYISAFLDFAMRSKVNFTFTIEDVSILGKSLHLPLVGLHRIKTGEPKLDEKFVIHASDEDRAVSFFRDHDRARAAIKIMESGFYKMENKNGVLSAKCFFPGVGGAFLEKLARLGKALLGVSFQTSPPEEFNPKTVNHVFDYLAKLA